MHLGAPRSSEKSVFADVCSFSWKGLNISNLPYAENTAHLGWCCIAGSPAPFWGLKKIFFSHVVFDQKVSMLIEKYQHSFEILLLLILSYYHLYFLLFILFLSFYFCFYSLQVDISLLAIDIIDRGSMFKKVKHTMLFFFFFLTLSSSRRKMEWC